MRADIRGGKGGSHHRVVRSSWMEHLYSFSSRQSLIATSSGIAEFSAGCATAEEMLLARDVLMFLGCRVEALLHMDSAAARGICRREGVWKDKSLEVRTLWLQQVVKAKTLTFKTVKSQGNCADLGTKTLTAGTLSLLRNLNGLVDKKTFPVECNRLQSLLVNLGCSEQQRWKCWNGRSTRLQGTIGSRQGEALSQNSCVPCVRTRSRVGAGGSHHDLDVGTVAKSLVAHAHLPRLLSCLYFVCD